ncbi:MAG: DUF3324 domain-containing protein [Bifidobacteriaceae bacterium]|nr:DUF3324 domain-containing protein [Bifidobacteriaceae bacterium]
MHSRVTSRVVSVFATVAVVAVAFAVVLATTLFATPITPAHAAGFGLTVTPNLPAEQRPATTSYFDIEAAPSHTTTMKVTLTNKTSAAMKVSATVVPAQTSESGSVAYQSTVTDKKLLVRDLRDDVSVKNQTLTIPANGTTSFTTKLTMPATAFDGVMAGGIAFEQLNQNSEKTSKSGGVGIGIASKYRYVIAVLARNNEKIVPSDLTFGTTGVQQVNYKNRITLQLRNTRATFINQLQVSATASLKGHEETSYKQSATAMQMAPTSSFAYAIPLPDDVTPGTYAVSATAYYVQDSAGAYTGANGQKFKYRKVFNGTVTVSSDKAKSMAESIGTIRDAPGPAWWVYAAIIAALVFLILLIIAYVLYRRKQNETKRLRSELAAQPCGSGYEDGKSRGGAHRA